jgi:hypothetical protein
MKVFISHHSSDADWAREIAKSLNEAGFETWADDRVLPGDNFASLIGEALESSNAMVVLVSPESMKSTWVLNEIGFAIGSEKYKDRLIPVMVRPTDRTPTVFKKLPNIKGIDAASPESVAKRIISRLQKVPA